MTFLKFDDEIITSNKVKFGPGNRCNTNKPFVSKGKWYFEVSNEINEENDFLAVWRIKDAGYFGYHSIKYEYSPLIYSYSQGNKINFMNDTSQYDHIYLNFDDVSCDDTVGIGLDIDTRTFYFRIKNHISIFKMNISITGKLSFNPEFFKPSDANDDDTISVNFEPDNFVYDVPFGFLPWGTPIKYCTCLSKRKSISMIFLVVCLINS